MKRDKDELREADYVVLGMIRLGARSGYEIKQRVESSIRFFWTISPAQIYPSLERLERRDLVAGKAECLGKRHRRIFAVTEAGEAALHVWLRRPEPIPFELRDVGMLKLFFADALDKAEASQLLGEIQRHSEARVAALRSIEPAAREAEKDGNVYPMLTLRIGLAFHRAMITVCNDFAVGVAEPLERANRRQ
jgi:DNA-binding PadR family transcriptional regulator